MFSLSPRWLFVIFVASFVILDAGGILFAEYIINLATFLPLLVIGLALIVIGSIAKVKY